MTLDEFYALRVQAALAGCAFTRSPGIHLAELDEYSGMLNDANKLVRELYQKMGRWIQH
jgi:hypothetical protein